MAVLVAWHRSRTAGGLATRDGAVAVVATALLLSSVWSWLHTTPTAEHSLDQSTRVAVLLLGAGALSLIWQRRAPTVVLAATGLALVGHELLADVSTPLPLAVLIALCAAAGACSRRVATGSAVAIVVFVVVGAVVHDSPRDVFVDYVLLVAVAWTLGSASRIAHARALALEQQTAAALRESEARATLAVQEERARIARELHDVVAHHVCVVVAQARAALAVFDVDPEGARTALRDVEGTGREALMEMRCLLDLLRPSEHVPAVAPQPGLEQLPGLIAHVRAAGLPVALEVHGEAPPLPAGLQVCAYRILQESLTNALKHGSRTLTTIDVSFDPGQLRLQVDDVAPPWTCPAPRTPDGRGIIGMQQRAGLVGGRLQAGPRPDGGFRVTATLPTTPRA